MAEEELDLKRRQQSDDDSEGWDVLLYAVAVVFLLPPALLGLGLYVLLARWLRRVDFVILGLFGLAGAALSAGWAFSDYIGWIISFIPGDARETQLLPPLLPVLIYSLPFTCVLGVVAGSRIAGKLPSRRARRFLQGRTVLDHDSVLPSDKERQRAVSSGPAGGLVVDASAHSLRQDAAQPGQRFIPLGINKHGEPSGVTEQELGMHMLVMGSTGSGKTVTLQGLASGLMDLGWHGLVLDLKEAGDLKDFFDEYCRHHSLPFQQLMLSDPAPDFWFNPMLGMKADSARDALVMTLNYGANAAYYEALNKKAAGQLLNLLYDAHEVDPEQHPFPTINEMGRLLAHGTGMAKMLKPLVATVVAANPARSPEDYQALIKPDKDQAEAASGLGTRLTNILDSQAGRTVLRPDPTRQPIDVTQDGLTYIGLDTQGRPEMSQVLASYVLQRMAVLSADRSISSHAGNRPRPRFLIVDEANQVTARPIILTLLQKARAAGITVILATQSPTDWIDDIGDDWDSMAQNCNVAMVMSQGARGPAEMCAELIGMERRYVAGLQYSDGDVYDAGNLREHEDYRVNPDQLRQLGIGEAVLRVGKPHERVEWLQIKMRSASSRAGDGPGNVPGAHGSLPTLGDVSDRASSGPVLLGNAAPDDDDDDHHGGSVGSSMPTPRR